MSRPSQLKNAPAIEDDDDPGLPVQRIVSAAGQPRPATSAVRSAFDAAVALTAPPATIAIRRGIAPPPGPTSRGSGVYRKAAAEMEVGDSAVLPLHQAKSLMRIARKFGNGCEPPRHFMFRTLDEHTAGVWRDR